MAEVISLFVTRLYRAEVNKLAKKKGRLRRIEDVMRGDCRG